MKNLKTMLVAMIAALAIGAVGASAASANVPHPDAAHLTITFDGSPCDVRADRTPWQAGPPGEYYTELTNVLITPGGVCGVDSLVVDEPITVAKTAAGEIWIEDQPLSVELRVLFNLVKCEYEGTAGVGTWDPGYGPIFPNDDHSGDMGKWIEDITGVAEFISGSGLCPQGDDLEIGITGWIEA